MNFIFIAISCPQLYNQTLITTVKQKSFRNHCRPYNQNKNQIILFFLPSFPQHGPQTGSSSNSHFLFPEVQPDFLPDPSRFFATSLLSSPLPTNSFFQNFVLGNGDQPEFIHPYLIKSSNSSLSVCYPSRISTSAMIYQRFLADLTISNVQSSTNDRHIISSFSDLSVTLDLPPNLRFFLVRGSPFLTCDVSNATNLSISTACAIISHSSNVAKTKHTIILNNNQTWLCYSSLPIDLTLNTNTLTSNGLFSGVIRFAILLDSRPLYETVLDRFSACYPISGCVVFTEPFSLEYRWVKKGQGDLLLLAHPLHYRLLSSDDGDFKILYDFKYNSMDGELVGVVGDFWTLRTSPISVTWHSLRGVREESYPEIISSLVKDVEALDSTTISTSSSYFYGKLIARAARLVLIAEEVCYTEIIPVIRKFLKDSIQPWLDGTFNSNGFLFDFKWGGIVSKESSVDSKEEFGFRIYNNHHCHLGYFLYAIAVLVKIDPAWGRKYKPQAYSLMADFMNLGWQSNSNYPRLRNFDLWKLHSWAGGVSECPHGRNQESCSEALNAYYSGALMGLSYGDVHAVVLGSSLVALEIHAAQTWWHVREGVGMYEADFSEQNRMVGVLWSNKRESRLLFATPEWRECRLGIQVLPLLPITEILFSDVRFVKELVKWVAPCFARSVGEGWKGFVYALESLYDKKAALKKAMKLEGFDNGNSLTNLLWWIHSRGDDFLNE